MYPVHNINIYNVFNFFILCRLYKSKCLHSVTERKDLVNCLTGNTGSETTH